MLLAESITQDISVALKLSELFAFFIKGFLANLAKIFPEVLLLFWKDTDIYPR
jgi:hypothetical protein